MSAVACGTCVFYVKWSSNLVVGHCHRYPPRPREKVDLEQADQFPVVSADSWCGEHRSKDA